MPAAVAVVWTLLLCAEPRRGEGLFDLAGHVAFEGRFFPRPPLFEQQERATLSPSLRIEPEVVHRWNEGLDRLTLIPFLRLDRHDGNRTHFDLRELSWVHLADSWSLFVGIGRVFWGVAESRHLVDIINQTDLVEDPDGEDKLGQAMVNVSVDREWGAMEVFLLPLSRERTFPDRDARLRGTVPIAGASGSDTFSGGASYESRHEEWHPSFAVRYSRSSGQLDLGVAYYRGTSREPRLLPEMQGEQLVVRPHYDLIDQSAVDLQWTQGAWLWKLEAALRQGHGDRFPALVTGFEYTRYQVRTTRADIGFLVEYLYDGRSTDHTVAPPTPFGNDLFVGLRLAFNNFQGTQLLGGAIFDLESGETLPFLELEHRLGESQLLELEGRWFLAVSSLSPTAGLERDGSIVFRLSRFF